MLIDEAFKEKVLDRIKNWQPGDEISLVNLRNAKVLAGTELSDTDIIDKLQNMMNEFSNDKEIFFVIVDFALKYALTNTIKFKKDMVGKLLDYITPKKRRYVKEDELVYDGENYSVLVSDDLIGIADLEKCMEQIRKHYNLSADTQFIYRFLKFNNQPEEVLPVVSKEDVLMQKEPRVTVTIYLKGERVDANSICNIENIDISFTKSPSVETETLLEMESKGVNPFDSKDQFFVNACALKNELYDETLAHRKDVYFVDPAVECNQQVGQVCSITKFDIEEVTCDCIGIQNNPPKIEESFVSTITKSNFRLFSCIQEVLEIELFSNVGFLLSLSILVIFYVFINTSNRMTQSRLSGKHMKSYLKTSLLILHNTEFSTDDYFEFVKVLTLSEEVVDTNARSSLRKGSDVELIINPETLKAETKTESYLKDMREDLIELAPTNLDFAVLSPEEQYKYDNRSFCQHFMLFCKLNNTYFNTFIYNNLLIPQQFRLVYMMTYIILAMALSAFFYNEELIKQRELAKEAVIM